MIKAAGVEKDLKEAMRWMRRAAEAGDAQAQAILGKACYEGWNYPKEHRRSAGLADARRGGVCNGFRREVLGKLIGLPHSARFGIC